MPTAAQIRQEITTKLIAALEQNTIPWRRPWITSPNSGRAANAISKRAYSGINPLLLELHSLKHGFRSRWFATFDQWKTLGGTVQKRPVHVEPGQWGCRIVFYRPVKRAKVDQATGEEREESFHVLRTYTVFCADQVDGAEAYRIQNEPDRQKLWPDYEPADQLIAATGADIRHEQIDKACYARPVPADLWPNHTDGDFIVLPHRNDFVNPEGYYSVAFHELSHWAELRTGWDHAKQGYAMGELAAEIAACYLATEIGIPQSDDLKNHAAYLQSWLGAMKGDPSYIFKAATQASKATDFLLSFVHQDASQEEAEEVSLS